MTRFDDIIGKEEKVSKTKKLKLILDEGDEILSSIAKGMNEHNLTKVKLDTIHGVLLKGTILDDQKNEKVEVIDKEIISAGGTFSLTAGDLWGTLSIFLDKIKPITGKVITATVKENTEIILSFEEKDIKRSSKK